MIIKRDLTITDVPGFESITVQYTARGEVATALLQSSYGTTEMPWAYGLKELTDLRDALTVCIEEMQPAPSATTQVPRVWHAGDPEPADVAKVTDKDGDVWERGAEDWRFESLTEYWARLLNIYGPVTEVLP
jgi:hypothetical protein